RSGGPELFEPVFDGGEVVPVGQRQSEQHHVRLVLEQPVCGVGESGSARDSELAAPRRAQHLVDLRRRGGVTLHHEQTRGSCRFLRADLMWSPVAEQTLIFPEKSCPFLIITAV